MFDKLELKHLGEWYRVSVMEIYNNGGGGLISYYYNGSLAEALPIIYPEHHFDKTKFPTTVTQLMNATSVTIKH